MCGCDLALVSDPKVIGYCEAQYDYSPMETNQIAFKVGEQIAILSKSRGNRGWWKGKIDGKVSSLFIFSCCCHFYRTTQLCQRDCGSHSSVRPSVCLSVCHTHALWQNETMHCGYFDTTRKDNHSSFLTSFIWNLSSQWPKSPIRHISTSNTFYIKASENSIIVNTKKRKSFAYPLVQNGDS